MMFVVVDCPVSIEADEEKARDFANHICGSYFEVKPGEGKFEWFHGTRDTERLEIYKGQKDSLSILTWSRRSLFDNYEQDEEFIVRDDGSTYARALTEARVREILKNGGL